MRILITNDDGIHAPGLRALAEAVATCAEVTIIAPEREQSAAGHSVTLHKPLRMREVKLEGLRLSAYSTNGTPADCIALGTVDRGNLPDLVLSGINAGANLAEEILYSGTASAAMEGALNDVTSFALSVTAPAAEARFDAAAAFARRIAEGFPLGAVSRARFFNVNVPNLPPEEIRGVEVTRLGHRCYVNRMEERLDPRGRAYYWFTGEPVERDCSPGTDIAAVASGRISITPLHFDLTSHSDIAPLVEALASAGLWPAG
jgi:5'/3'-nucleotidase